MLIKDGAACEEACRVRHPFGKVVTNDRPWESIGEDIQHERPTRRTVLSRDRCADNEIMIGGECRRLTETEEIRRCDCERCLLVNVRRFHPQLLEIGRSEQRQDDGLPRGEIELCPGHACCG